MLSQAVNTLASATFLSRKAVFENMRPAQLFVLSTHSDTSLQMIKTCTLKASLNIKYYSEWETTIHVTTSAGLFSEIYVASSFMNDEKVLNLTVDGELVERCILSETILIIPHELDLVLRRIFSIYSSVQTNVEKLEVIMRGDAEDLGLKQLLIGLKDKSNIAHVAFCDSRSTGTERRVVEGLEEVMEALKVEKTLSFETLPLNVPLQHLAVPHLAIHSDVGLSDEFIENVLMTLPHTIYIARSK